MVFESSARLQGERGPIERHHLALLVIVGVVVVVGSGAYSSSAMAAWESMYASASAGHEVVAFLVSIE